MSENKVVPFRKEGEIDDLLTEILRAGAKPLIEQAVEAEFAAFLTSHGDLKLLRILQSNFQTTSPKLQSKNRREQLPSIADA